MVFYWLFYCLNILVAATINPCGDFYTFACTQAQQGRNDGTGSLLSTSQRRRLLEEAILQERAQFDLDFDQQMQRDPKLKAKILATLQCEQGSPCEEPTLQEVQTYLYMDVTRAYSMLPSFAGLYAPLDLLKEATENSALRSLISQTTERVDQRIVPESRRNYVREVIFPEVRNHMISIVETLPAGPQRTRALARLREVEVDVRHCSVGRETIFVSNAYYDNKTVQVCMSFLLATDSMYALYSIIAHELAHSIDPVTSKVGTAELFAPLTRCLSRPRSIGMSPNTDPMSEAFCDWMGYEVVARLVQQSGHSLNRDRKDLAVGMANANPFCSSASPNRLRTNDTHPPGRDRIEMVAAQPALRQRLGCNNNSQLNYCPLQGLDERLQIPPTSEQNGIAH
jgi:hypothetical protein